MSNSQHYPFYLGGLSAAMASSITHPIDQCKYRLQVLEHKSGMLPTLISTVRKTGISSLWEGVSASILRQATYSTARFTFYEAIKSEAMKGREGPAPVWLLTSCAGVAGGLAGCIGNPVEVSYSPYLPESPQKNKAKSHAFSQIVLVRMCTDGVKQNVAARYNYSNGMAGLFLVARNEGTSALYRGLGPNVIRSVLMNVAQLAAYDSIKRSLLSTALFTDNVPLHLTCGLMAGTIATTVCAPVDVLKSRVQSASGPGVGLVKIMGDGMRAEGPMFFMRGWLPAWLRLTPNTVLMFVFLEQLKVGIDSYRNSGEKRTGALSE